MSKFRWPSGATAGLGKRGGVGRKNGRRVGRRVGRRDGRRVGRRVGGRAHQVDRRHGTGDDDRGESCACLEATLPQAMQAAVRAVTSRHAQGRLVNEQGERAVARLRAVKQQLGRARGSHNADFGERGRQRD